MSASLVSSYSTITALPSNSLSVVIVANAPASVYWSSSPAFSIRCPRTFRKLKQIWAPPPHKKITFSNLGFTHGISKSVFKVTGQRSRSNALFWLRGYVQLHGRSTVLRLWTSTLYYTWCNCTSYWRDFNQIQHISAHYWKSSRSNVKVKEWPSWKYCELYCSWTAEGMWTKILTTVGRRNEEVFKIMWSKVKGRQRRARNLWTW